MPPLRDRREDIPLLADHFVRLYASENDKPISGLEPEAMKALLDYDYPGNVRELENAIERAVVLCSRGSIGLDLLPETVMQPGRGEVLVRLPENGSTYRDLIEEYERRLIRTALRPPAACRSERGLLTLKPTTLHESQEARDPDSYFSLPRLPLPALARIRAPRRLLEKILSLSICAFALALVTAAEDPLFFAARHPFGLLDGTARPRADPGKGARPSGSGLAS